MLWKSENETPKLKFLCVLTVFFSDSRFSPWGWPQIWACTHIIQNILVLLKLGVIFSLFRRWRCDAVLCVFVWQDTKRLCRSQWSGCIKVAMVIWQQTFSHLFSILALVLFLVKFILKSAPKPSFSLWRRDPVLELQFLLPLCTLKSLCKSFSVQKDPCVEASLVKVCPCTASLWKEVKRWEELTRGEKSWDELSRGERAEKTEKS